MSRIQQLRSTIQTRTGIKVPGSQVIDGVFSGQVISAGQPIIPQVQSRVQGVVSKLGTGTLGKGIIPSGGILSRLRAPPAAAPSSPSTPSAVSTGSAGAKTASPGMESFSPLRTDRTELAASGVSQPTARLST